MNFKTRLSYNNRILFLYENGEVRQTNFVEVSFYGDSYILAKTSDAIFYTLLDLNGNVVDNLHIVHRFQNGLLLTYDVHVKEYVSSDKCRYNINYNVYSVYNADTRRSYTVNIIQSDNLLKSQLPNVLNNRPCKVAIKHFLNRPVYKFNDFIFTEIIDNQYIITGTILSLTNRTNDAQNVFDAFYGKKIWTVIDIFTQKPHNGETEIKSEYASLVTFGDAEIALSELILMPEEPVNEDYPCTTSYADASSEFHMYTAWRKKNRWQQVISNLLSVNHN